MKAPLTRTLWPAMPSAGGCRPPANGSVSWLWRSKLRSAIISGMSRSPRGSGSESSKLVVDDPHPGQAAPDVRRGPVEAVVVVPLERGPFRAAVLDQVVDVGFAPPRRQQQVVAGLARREAPRDAAEVGDRLRLGQAARLAVELGAVVAAVQVDRELARLGRQLVVEGDLGPLAGGAADRRPGEAAAVGPQLRLAAGQDLRLGLADRDLDLGRRSARAGSAAAPGTAPPRPRSAVSSPNGSSSPRPPPLTGSR